MAWPSNSEINSWGWWVGLRIFKQTKQIEQRKLGQTKNWQNSSLCSAQLLCLPASFLQMIDGSGTPDTRQGKKTSWPSTASISWGLTIHSGGTRTNMTEISNGYSQHKGAKNFSNSHSNFYVRPPHYTEVCFASFLSYGFITAIMAIPVVEFSNQGYEIRKIFA